MDIDKALTAIDTALENHWDTLRGHSEAEAEEFHLCIEKLHEIIADYCSRSH